MICHLCKNGVEDEIHFVMNCTQFEELRAKMLQLVENKYVAFESLNDEQKRFYLFTNEDKDVCHGISKFTFEGFKQREKNSGQVNDWEVIANYYKKYWLHPHRFSRSVQLICKQYFCMFFFHVLALAMKIVMFFEPIKHIKIEIELL